MKKRLVGAFGVVAIVALAACTPGATTAPPTTAVPTATTAPTATATAAGGTITNIKLGVDLPLSGGEVANGQPTLNGILLAVKQWNDASMNHSYTVGTNVQDDALAGVHDPQTGAGNADTLVADAQVVGMVGPFNSNVARAIIPVANEAGLAQCSPSNTGTDLTKEGSEAYRFNGQDERNYFRVATPDDIQGPAAAQYAYNDLGKSKAVVIDDTEAFGVGVANSFEEEFKNLGGTIILRQGNNFKDSKSFISILTSPAEGSFDVIYFGGTQTNGGGQVRRDMGASDMLDIPLVGPDGITDLGKGGDEGTFITLAGVENSANVFGTVAGANALELDIAADFNAAYQAEYNTSPGAYSALAYACTQVLLQAADAAIAGAADLAALREAVRTSIIGGSTKWNTVLGEISFDANGDSSQKWISFYKTDPTLNDGLGGWVFDKQQDFSVPAP